MESISSQTLTTDTHQFHHFQKLPEHIREKIWTHVAYFPRVVSVLERHYLKSTLDNGSDETEMFRLSRNPLMMTACSESRRVALSIYSRIDKEVLRWPSSPTKPTYVNPDVDIIYRGRTSCRKGDAFRMRCQEWAVDQLPIAFTRTLAVDLTALTRPRELSHMPSRAIRKLSKAARSEEEGALMISTITEALRKQTYIDIGLCCKKGLQEIVVVVGNDEDKPDFNLIPLEHSNLHGSMRGQMALAAIDTFSRGLAEHWTAKEIKQRIPDFRAREC
ncbi:uncharacterized protein LY89DRAFT_182686 [Mollisia scopiformis]|uniref:2EXR domain-containing protein n=1 Tax=Mollisia scopiformis TaxID=149040 RepID=A0A194XTH4_MOLSC|nr:uncharacterized protein LY89DRAFT_182686 [Mollisia scopiformis]KUJ23441.1 hypothetical protein LY89DRAFT_182686 [Mollisia scopiformis]